MAGIYLWEDSFEEQDEQGAESPISQSQYHDVVETNHGVR
jgi:hypothetical protein